MNLTDVSTIKELLSRHGFHFSKAMGQNFLINPSVCPKMAELCGAAPGVGVLEIGPGIGVLTKELSARAERVAAIELDRRLPPLLRETLKGRPNVSIIEGDALKLNLAAILEREFPGMEAVVCANLPYYITSPMIMHLLESRLPVKSVTVMVQLEAARRLCARPGTREAGAVTLAVHYYSEPKLLFPVSRGSFLPAPNVDSAVIRMDIRPVPPAGVRDEALLFRIIRLAFAQRRKTVHNAVGSDPAFGKAHTAAALSRAGLSPTARAEQLALEDFIRLSNQLAEGEEA